MQLSTYCDNTHVNTLNKTLENTRANTNDKTSYNILCNIHQVTQGDIKHVIEYGAKYDIQQDNERIARSGIIIFTENQGFSEPTACRTESHTKLSLAKI